MPSFQILCTTMHQTDFSKADEMNVHCDVIFANQGDFCADQTIENNGHIIRMISTKTIGVGKNRNLAQIYADADICLLGDDDIIYKSNVEQIVINEFERYPDADVILFHLESNDSTRSVAKPEKTRKIHQWSRLPWGGAHVAYRRESALKANLWFSTLFGGGCVFPSGEDTIWLTEARKKRMILYASSETIGQVDMSTSSWYSGANERFFYGKGALYEAMNKSPRFVWNLYYSIRYGNRTHLSLTDRMAWIRRGREGFRLLKSYDDYEGRKSKDA